MHIFRVCLTFLFVAIASLSVANAGNHSKHRDGEEARGLQKKQKPILTACIRQSPTYHGHLHPNGRVLVKFKKNKWHFQFIYDLNGLAKFCRGCSIHIHESSTCNFPSSSGGYFWNRISIGSRNPWQSVVYYTDHSGRAKGKVKNFVDGYYFHEHIHHTVVVRNEHGHIYGCGLLTVGKSKCPSRPPVPSPVHRPVPHPVPKPIHKPVPKPTHKPVPKPTHKPVPMPVHKPTLPPPPPGTKLLKEIRTYYGLCLTNKNGIRIDFCAGPNFIDRAQQFLLFPDSSIRPYWNRNSCIQHGGAGSFLTLRPCSGFFLQKWTFHVSHKVISKDGAVCWNNGGAGARAGSMVTAGVCPNLFELIPDYTWFDKL